MPEAGRQLDRNDPAGASAPAAEQGTLGIMGWAVRTARLMVGVPDYDTYVAHRRETHPGEPIMTYEEFFRERQDARYGFGKGGRFRCC